MKTTMLTDRAAFIRANLRIVPVPFLPRMRIYAAHPKSGLRRLADTADRPPYWAYLWAGGAALARHIAAHPETVAGRTVLDLGAGSGVVAIAAALSGAAEVIAAEIDTNGIAAIGLNAGLNGVTIAVAAGDLTEAQPPPVDIVVVGDLFYDADLAARVTAFLDRCLLAGIDVLVGDPGRAPLPRERLRLLQDYQTADFADGAPKGASAVYSFHRGESASASRGARCSSPR